MTGISGSVGQNGLNRATDVALIQQLLNNQKIPGEVVPLKVDGDAGTRTIRRIGLFQKFIEKIHFPDCRVDPNGKTLAMLLAGNTSESNSKSIPAPYRLPDSKTNMPESLKSASQFSVSDQGMTLLKKVEKLQLKPYDDQTSMAITKWVKGATIGYGHLIIKTEWDTYKSGITELDASKLFSHDLAPFVNTVQSAVKAKLRQNEFDALVMLVFNIGAANFEPSSVVKLINDPAAHTNYSSLESAWKAWNKSQGKVMKGLDNRRQCEWDVYSKGIYKGW